MAFENLFIRVQRSIGSIQLDAVLVEAHTSSVRLTKNPVEFGADITDHAIVEPKRLRIDASVSDSPLGLAAFAQIVDLITGLFGTSTIGSSTRSNTAFNALTQLQDAREPLEIQTKLKLYENMIITNISTVQDKDSSRVVEMSIDLEEVIIVGTDSVDISVGNPASGSPFEQASQALEKGRQQAPPVGDGVQTSVLKQITNWLGN